MMETMPVSTSSSLLEQVRQRNDSAWRKLSQIFAPEVYRWCRNAGLQSSDAADVVQEVFLAVSENIDGFRHDRPGDTFRGWLWTIYRSKRNDHFRRHNMKPPEDGNVDPMTIAGSNLGSASNQSADSEAAAVVRRALKIIEKDFSQRTWQSFWRSAVLEERTTTIAQDLGITAAAVCMCRARVLQRLRETLADLGIFPNE